ncbi:RIMS-binding protein 2-like [Penaeus japonicus]|uniref:RIMS-binding protein 2-like n=1 Tax=Penaeus japonicus TaxID=27405 RepID=UPI001C7178E2|nr:RIMS-binding protein 2-like [Penaeus japonicus]
MKEAADKRRELERQHAEALAQLRERQAAISDTSRYNDKDRKASVEVIEALQSKIRELEKKAEAQNLRHEELLLEMQSLKKSQGSPKNSWSRSGSLSADLQSPESGDVTPGELTVYVIFRVCVFRFSFFFLLGGLFRCISIFFCVCIFMGGGLFSYIYLFIFFIYRW